MGSSMAGMGGQSPAPMNAPPAGLVATGVQPGAPGVTLAHYVIVFGAAGGLFVYNGTPALGNPPIFWATSATVDPFGNAIPNDSTAGVAGTGTFSAGNTIINASGTFVYSSTPALGNLIASFASAGGFDTPGNSYLAGNVGYTFEPSEPAYYAVSSSANGIAVYRATTEAGPWTLKGGLAYVAVGNAGMQIYNQTSHADLTMLDATDGAGNVFTELSGILSLTPAVGTPTATPSGNALVYADTNGVPRTLSAGDGNIYVLGALTLTATATPSSPQTIGTLATITRCSFTGVSGRRYRFEATVQFQATQSASTANWSVSTPGISKGWISGLFANNAGTIGGAQPSTLSSVNTGTLTTASGNYTAILKGDFTLNANGTVALQASCPGAPTDTFKILNADFVIYPVS